MEKDFNLRRAGTGGSEHPDLPAEFSGIPHDRGTIGAARSQNPNSANSQFFINFKDNGSLDKMGFPAFAEVVSGMDVVEAINKEYGDEPSQHQGEITRFGNPWLKEHYPKLDFIKSAELVK